MLKKHLKLLLVFALILSSGLAQAQNRSRLDVMRAGKLFDGFEFVEAAKIYERLVARDSSFSYAKLQLAESYRLMNQPEKAALWYAEVVNDSISDPIHKLYYAQALMSNGQYDRARSWLERYNYEADDSTRARNLIAGIDNFEAFYQDSARFKIDTAAFNSEGSDFSPVYYREGVVFSSNRSGFKIVKRRHGWDDTNFLQIYHYKPTSDSTSTVDLFSDLLNTKYHEGPLSFYDDFEKVIFTRNNYNGKRVGKAEDETIHLQLYLSERASVNSKWSKPQPFPYNNKEYSVGHPAISSDEKTLYFSSDMPGGQGGVDLYMSQLENGNWSEPVNLGPKINTSGDEVFPFVKDSVLFFSSDGHYGVGGLDIYQVVLTDSTETVYNMGIPMNSRKDDFGIILGDSLKSGYFTSNRDGGMGSDDIYSFSIVKPPKPENIAIKGIVVDQRSGAPLGNADVFLSTDEGDSIKITTQADGNFEFVLDWDKDYDFTATKPDWSVGLDSAKTFDDVLDKEFLTIPLRELLVVKGDLVTPAGTPVDNALVTFTETTTGEVDSVRTNENGLLYFIAQPDAEYDVFLQKEGYFNFRTKVETGSEPGGIIKFDLEMDEIVIGRAIRIENIYFDLNKSDIRPDAAIELDKIVAMMTDNPTIKIELGSHTDSRGGDPYNLALSDRRARSSAAYIVSRGIAQDRIVGKGYGETQLVNQCEDGVACSTEEHQANRRTEFKVVSY
ncbi:hypothetical protein BFP97_20070 [Roseivirga sp. 4D4]|uniref:OmpA family protein n=1 Tax=Roseivirga sp. 4D4 TaxID=1889784 RepID=UPI000853087C|nr:OmpA family protein [Roseivirga sp. 4D4]OEK03673.1 hypothetical protein BFP97_20070 [Roseivirga sp. 4D4]